MAIKMTQGHSFTNSPKIQMRKIIISRGSHRQANKEQFLKNGQSAQNYAKINGKSSRISFFQDELLINTKQKSALINQSQQKFNLNSSRLSRKTPRLSSSLSKLKDSGIISSFTKNPEQQRGMKSNGSSLSLRRDSIVQREQKNISIGKTKDLNHNKPLATIDSMSKLLDQIQKKLYELIKSKLYHVENQLKLKKVLQTSSKVTERQQQSLLKLVQTEKFEIFENQIKKVQNQLAQLDLDVLKRQDQQNQNAIIKLSQKKGEIIQQILAQKIVESELYKKYYMGFRSMDRNKNNCLGSRSCTRNNESQQLVLNRNKMSSQNKNPKKVEQIQSLNKLSYKNPKYQDYETYRYKKPLYKANLQPLPRSVYQAQYLQNGVKQVDRKCSFIQNIIFGNSERSKSSNYRDSFNRVLQKHQLVNHKQLDAYKDKFRDLKLSYLPKKRTQTQEASRKVKKNQAVDYLQQLKSTKLFALQSQRSTYQMKGLEPVKESFLSQKKRQFQGCAGIKSQIKHKQLNNFRYQFKKMFHS